MDSNNQTLLTVFVALTGVAVLLQAGILLGMFLVVRKSAKAILTATDDLKATVLPIVHTTHNLLERMGPQLVTVSADLADISQALRRETAATRVSVSEIMDRLNQQTKRLDQMLTGGLNYVEKAGTAIEAAVGVPVRQVNGIFAAMKAVIETYRSEVPPRRTTYSDGDKDLFI